MFKEFCLRLCIVLFLAFPVPAAAQEGDIKGVGTSASESIFDKDRVSLQLVAGSLFSPTVIATRTRVFDYGQVNLRIARMLSSPSQSHQSLLRGNFEAILELSNSVIYKGPGRYMGGLTGLIRYNFVQPDLDLSAYFQTGIGAIYTDAYKVDSQDAIGRAIEFTPQASIGIRYLFNENWSLDAEVMFHHISNAGLSERNDGINALGGFIGLTYFFNNSIPKMPETSFKLDMNSIILEEVLAGENMPGRFHAVAEDPSSNASTLLSHGPNYHSGSYYRTASFQLVWETGGYARRADYRFSTTSKPFTDLYQRPWARAWMKGGAIKLLPALDRSSYSPEPSPAGIDLITAKSPSHDLN